MKQRTIINSPEVNLHAYTYLANIKGAKDKQWGGGEDPNAIFATWNVDLLSENFRDKKQLKSEMTLSKPGTWRRANPFEKTNIYYLQR